MNCLPLHKKRMLELQNVTCHRDHTVLHQPPDTGERALP